jgi:hypothetical protein
MVPYVNGGFPGRESDGGVQILGGTPNKAPKPGKREAER